MIYINRLKSILYVIKSPDISLRAALLRAKEGELSLFDGRCFVFVLIFI